MRHLTLVFINLRRHRLRAAIGVAGIAFGVAAMLTILAIVTGAIGMFQRILSTDSHYLVFERNVSDLFFSSVTAEQVDLVRARPEVAEAHPMLFGIVTAAGHPVITCFGIEAADPRLARAEWLAGTREAFGRTEGEVFLGSRAAEFLQAKLGQELEIGRSRFRVGGIFRTENGFEDGGVFLPLATAQEFFHRGTAASVVAVKLRDQSRGAEFKQAVEAALPGVVALENREFSSGYSSFKILNLTAWAVGLCAFALGGLGVANTMLLSVFSRIREIAVLRVCGFSRPQVAALIFSEAVAVAALGIATGLILGFGLLAIVERVPQFQGYVQATVQPLVLVGIVVTALATAVLGAIYPARFASTIQPAEALRYE
ncbi:Lipoprotein-releasing system transmembrane protein LolE [Lacunisphaera limnophila]|uniref:Lipoprotein-releasing system transmembrane protein LolE n=1 Tax=Lacunisphaera limnophila TaxID=1838286 RepID=A0A1D8AZT9_9BACT|nr:ABC transporter permease [Lacunisphaera limnophila]AOS46395.1 Lipoprotein-releasing system transmembrane protein LolE [Lacunisphaera limnophila]